MSTTAPDHDRLVTPVGPFSQVLRSSRFSCVGGRQAMARRRAGQWLGAAVETELVAGD